MKERMRVLDEDISLEKRSEEPPTDEAQKTEKAPFYLLIIFVLLIGITALALVAVRQLHKDPVPETVTLDSGFEFVYYDGLWHTEWQEGNNIYTIHLHYNPDQVANVTMIGSLNETAFNELLQTNNTLYITFDPLSHNLNYLAVSAAELSVNLARALHVTPTAACIRQETDACEGRPIITCENAALPTIFLKDDPTEAIISDGLCITIQGDKEALLRGVDKVLFTWYGMI